MATTTIRCLALFSVLLPAAAFGFGGPQTVPVPTDPVAEEDGDSYVTITIATSETPGLIEMEIRNIWTEPVQLNSVLYPGAGGERVLLPFLRDDDFIVEDANKTRVPYSGKNAQSQLEPENLYALQVGQSAKFLIELAHNYPGMLEGAVYDVSTNIELPVYDMRGALLPTTGGFGCEHSHVQVVGVAAGERPTRRADVLVASKNIPKGLSWKGFEPTATDPDKLLVRQGLEDVLVMLEVAANGPECEDKLFPWLFGEPNWPRLEEVRDKIRKAHTFVERALNGQTALHFVNQVVGPAEEQCSSWATYAFVFSGSPRRIYLCPAFFSGLAHGPFASSSVAGVLVHEILHWGMTAGLVDVRTGDRMIYGLKACVDMARTRPELAITNSDNYQRFIEHANCPKGTDYTQYTPRQFN